MRSNLHFTHFCVKCRFDPIFAWAYHLRAVTNEIRLSAPHPRFRPRVEGDLRRPGHPGTAVRIGEDLYEVVAAERSGEEWVYRLEPWPDQETIRAYVEWGENAAREFAAGLRDEQIRGTKNTLAWAAQAFLGFLPAGNQERLSQARGLDPARATLWSAVLEALVALPFAFLFFIGLFAGRDPVGSIPAWAGGLAFIALADGIFRLVVVISTGEPIGSLFLALLGLRSRSKVARDVPGDEIAEIGGTLTVLSPVPKVWWERAGGVTYDGEPYILAGSGRERTKFFYRFRKGGVGFPVLDPELEKLRDRSSDLSYVFAPLWGFLPPELQGRLEFYGRYRARPYVLLSIGLTFLAALALIGPGLKNVSRGTFGIWGLIPLAIALYFFAESFLRLVRLTKDGRTGGSCLALFIKPFYDRAFKDRPVARS
jgi:hypothetical protein